MSRLLEVMEGQRPAVAAVIDEPITEVPRAAALEIRADKFTQMQEVDALIEFVDRPEIADTPIIYTVRTEDEGGAWTYSDSERYMIFADAMPHVDAVDVEIGSSDLLREICKLSKIGDVQDDTTIVIASFHDYEATPTLDFLGDVYSTGMKFGATVVKVATRLDTKKDYDTLKAFTLKFAMTGVIAVGLGRLGPKFRKRAFGFGSILGYAAIGEHLEPGQLTLDEMNTFLDQNYPDQR